MKLTLTPPQQEDALSPERDSRVWRMIPGSIDSVFLGQFASTHRADRAGASNPNFYELCEFVAIGPSGKGFGKICPRDGKVNCSIVDALETPRQM